MGNHDSDTIIYNNINPPITARYIRLRPAGWNGRISMRMEFYGCQGILHYYYSILYVLFVLVNDNGLALHISFIGYRYVNVHRESDLFILLREKSKWSVRRNSSA